MKKLFIAVAAIAAIATMLVGSHVYRADAVVSAITYYGIEETVYVDLDNGHRYAFDVVDGEDIYNVGGEMTIAMWDGFTPEDPTDDIIL